ncbi:unnamed protein product [Vitrella brassicaformis CCMP3155]|uniref:U1-type domain-containing protein n=1 Tax=Vitrella brassicaformis (strain CCMP3155) TaxID=1169540 RepID=A0A0G4GR89_VITBC|nr:unnamed protein product [Vitrella brassicaformis CCMP3155]|eukprot:CEM33047.1 unnamed protein product [Vitrella brassicaformis CCMP3155]
MSDDDSPRQSKSKSKPREQTDKSGRKVWDKEYYAKRAKERAEDEEILALVPESKKKKVAPPPQERQPLKERHDFIDLEERVGKTQVVTQFTPKQQQGGYWCSVCECLIKDSQAYLDHVNGKRHNRMLGMTMRVERVDVNRVKDRLASLKRSGEADTSAAPVQVDDIQQRLRQLQEQEEEKKRRKRERRSKKHKTEAADDIGDGVKEEPRAIKDEPQEAAAGVEREGQGGVRVKTEPEEDEKGGSAAGAAADGGGGGGDAEEDLMKLMGLPVGFTAGV